LRKLLVAVVLSFFAGPVFATSLQDFDAKLETELRARDAGALAIWQQANAARDAGKHDEAIRLYREVYARVPGFSHALRRIAGEQIELRDREGAVKSSREAVAQERSPQNLSMLAEALIVSRDGEVLQSYAAEAMNVAREAAALAPREWDQHATVAHVAIVTNDVAALREATEKLEELEPDNPNTHVIRMVLSTAYGDWEGAQADLERAHEKGLPDAAYESMQRRIQGEMPSYRRWWKPAAIALGAWFAGFALLLIAGAVLSRIALRAAQERPADLSENATQLSSGVRKAYGAVLVLCSAFYYISIPIVIASVLALGGGLIYAFFAIGHIPIKLVILLVLVIGVTIISILKSLFIRVRDNDPGMKVDLAREPRLRALLEEVAARIGTRPVDNVYLTPSTDVAVYERGKRKPKERCLILGIAALDGLELRPLKAVLGHEYGHFTNRDTGGGTFALAVRNSLNATAISLIRGGAAAWYNPAWLFVNGFNRVFLRISEGASRLHEVLADRWAVFAYGADAFEAGLRHVVERGLRFDAHVGATLKEVVEGKVPLANLYTYAPKETPQDLSSAIEDALNRKSSPYDSHPTPAERFALVRALPQHGSESGADDHLPAWSLFTDPLAMQQSMTAQVRENVRNNYGVEIAAPVMG